MGRISKQKRIAFLMLVGLICMMVTGVSFADNYTSSGFTFYQSLERGNNSGGVEMQSSGQSISVTPISTGGGVNITISGQVSNGCYYKWNGGATTAFTPTAKIGYRLTFAGNTSRYSGYNTKSFWDGTEVYTGVWSNSYRTHTMSAGGGSSSSYTFGTGSTEGILMEMYCTPGFQSGWSWASPVYSDVPNYSLRQKIKGTLSSSNASVSKVWTPFYYDTGGETYTNAEGEIVTFSNVTITLSKAECEAVLDEMARYGNYNLDFWAFEHTPNDVTSGSYYSYFRWIDEATKLSTIDVRSALNTGAGRVATFTLNKNGGSGGTSSVTATMGSTLPSISIPSKTGYLFSGYTATVSPDSYSVTTNAGGYGFALSGGYYTSQNTGVHSSFAMAKINTFSSAAVTLTIKYICQAENNYDFALFSNIDQPLAANDTADTTYYKCTKGDSSSDLRTLTYTVPAGTHTIYVKYRKDVSQSAGADNLRFTVSMTRGRTSSYSLTTYNASGSSSVVCSTILPSTFTASWSPITYYVAYNANGGSGTTSASTHTYGTAKALNANGFSRTGYRFAGWATSASGGVAYSNSQSVSNLSTSNGATVTLYAKWTPNTYSVSYNGNGNTGGSTASSSHTYGTAKALTANGFTKTGYHFAGWATSASGGVAYSNSQSVSNLTSTNGGTVTLYAKWTPNTYTVSYNGNGNTGGSTASSSHTYGTAKALTANGFTKNGYEFIGWATSASGAVAYSNSQSVSNLTTTNGGTVTLYAKWKESTYTVHFEANGGSGSMSNQTIYYTVSTALTANAFSKTGYLFSSWNTRSDGTGASYSNKASVLNLTSAGSTINLYARWTPVTYYVAFAGNGNTSGSTATQTFTYDTAQNLTANGYVKTGYSFAGWSNGSSTYYDQQNVKNLTTTSGGTVTMTAKWTANSYTVTLNQQGGTGGTGSLTAVYNSALSPIAKSSRAGYTFQGYFTGTNGTGTQYYNADGTEVRNWDIASDTTLYAFWVPNDYNVTFDKQNGTGGSATTIATYGKAMPTITMPTRVGYILGGYFSGTNGSGSKYYGADGYSAKAYDIAGEATMYAEWTPISYTIRFNKNDSAATGDMTDQAFSYDEAKDLSELGFVKPGYLFAGWATSENGAVVYTDQQSVSNLTTTDGAVIDLYAKWSSNIYYVEFDANTGSGSMTPQTIIYDRPTVLSENTFTKNGYHFAGWSTSTSGAVVYTNKQAVLNLVSENGGTIKLYAIWEPNTYYLRFNPAGGSGTMTNQQFKYDTAQTITTCTYTRAGYVFSGWATAAGGAVTYTDGENVTNLSDEDGDVINLYAVWTANKWYVQFMKNDTAATGSMDNLEFFYDTAKNLTENGFSKTGYHFASWNTAEGGTGASFADKASVKNLTTTPNGYVKLYAQWVGNEYSVRFNKNADAATGTMSDQAFTYDVEQNLTTNAFLRTGYTFGGWAASTSGSVAYSNGQKVKNLTTGTSVFDLYAKWTANTYTVVYNKNNANATGSMSNQSFTYDVGKKLLTNTFTLNGYHFKGWATSASGSVVYSDTATVQNLASTQGATVNLYAVWEANAYEIVFEKNAEGVTGTMANLSMAFDQAKNLTDNAYARTGYIYSGWNTQPDGTGTGYANKASVKNLTTAENGTVHLYAIWTPITYTFSFSVNHSAGSGTMENQTYKYDETKNLSKNTMTVIGSTFAGWSLTSDGIVQFTDEQPITNYTAENGKVIPLYALWSTNPYYIHFNANTPNYTGTMENQTFVYDTKQALRANAFAKAGYYFDGWATVAGGAKIYEDKEVVKNLTATSGETIDLYAHWLPNHYKVRFDKNAAEAMGSMPDQEHAYDVSQDLTPNAYKRTGYLFTGWNSMPDGTGIPYSDETSVMNLTTEKDGIVTVYAQWTPITFYVNFNGNGSDGGSMSQTLTFTYNEAQKLPVNVFTRAGYIYRGWNTKADGSGVSYYDEGTVKNLTSTHLATVTLFAKWEIRRYVLKFSGNGATSGDMPNQNFDYFEEKAISKNQFERTGYTYTGWLCNIAGVNKAFTDQEVVKNLTLENNLILTMNAQWMANRYTVKFDKNASDATGNMGDLPMTYDTAKALTANGFSRRGYSFAGWSTNKNAGTGEYADKASVKNLTAEDNGTVTLYAVWNANTITINLDKANGTGGTNGPIYLRFDDAWYADAQASSKITAVTIPSRTGYTFTGYYNGSTKEIDAGGTILASTSSHAETATLTAHWTANTYQLSFDKNDSLATGTMENQTLTYDTDAAISGNGFAKTGFHFGKWSTNSDGSGTTYSNGQSVRNLKSAQGDVLKLFANWTANNYTVTFSKNDPAATGSMGSQIFTYGVSQKLSALGFAKTGYHFDRWTLNAGGTGTAYTSQQSVSNLTTANNGTVPLYAQWEANNYKVVFHKNHSTATGTMADQPFTYDISANLTANGFSRTGYLFAGWNLKEDGTGQSFADRASVRNLTAAENGTVDLYAIWTPIHYIVRFDKNFDLATGTMGDQIFTYDQLQKLTANGYSRTGYLFDGWSVASHPTAADRSFFDEEEILNLTATDGQVITLYAQWIGNAYTIEFLPNATDATGQMGKQNVVFDTATNLKANTFVRTGYHFNAWNTNAGGTGASYTDKSVVVNLATGSETTKLYAQWAANTYSVIYNKNAASATGTTASTVLTYNVSGSIAANGFTREGYSFLSWNTKIDGSGTTYQPGNSVTNLTTANNGIINLYAIWKPVSYTVSFDKNSTGAAGTMDSMSFVYDEMKELKDNGFSYSGYAFDGWNTKADGKGTKYVNKQSVKNLTSVNGATITLFAQWKPIVYTVTFIKNDAKATGTMSDMTLSYNETATLTQVAFAKTGYKFRCWTTEADGTGAVYSDKASVKNLANTAVAVSLYAQWDPITFHVKFDPNDAQADGSMGMQEYSYDTLENLDPNGFTKKGYVFSEWNTKPDGTGTAYKDKQAVKNLSSIDGAQITLYARWARISYNVAFDGNGATGGKLDTVSGYYDQSIALPKNTFVRTGYVFSKWNTALDGSGTYYSDSASVQNLTDLDGQTVTLYAQWTANTYSVHFDGNGSSTGAMADQTIAYDKEVELAANTFTKAGYDFAGWSSSKDGAVRFTDKQKVGNLTIQNGGKVTFYAVWKPYSYTVTFNAGATDAVGTMEPQTFTVGEQKALSPNVFTRDGSVFKGWNLTPGKAVLYADKAVVKNLSVTKNGNVTLYAQWGEASYFVDFDGNGATGGTMVRQNFAYGESQDLSQNKFTKNGYGFVGWNTQPDGKGESFTDEENVSNLTNKNGDVVKLYAQWETVSYTITYELNGGRFTDGYIPTSGRNWDDVTHLPTASNVVKDGYIFVGWYKTAGFYGTPITTVPAGTGDITLYAKFRTYSESGTSAITEKEKHSFSFDF